MPPIDRIQGRKKIDLNSVRACPARSRLPDQPRKREVRRGRDRCPGPRYGADMESRIIGLRAQDVYSGLQTVDQTSGIIAAELDVTRLTGMAATVAANIKGIDIIKDPKTLRVIAAQQWGIDSFALPHVLELLQEVDYVTLRQNARGKTIEIDEHIPLLHDARAAYRSMWEQGILEQPMVDLALAEAFEERRHANLSAVERLGRLLSLALAGP
jgi:hypothetical protein